MATLYGVSVDWPVCYADLEPFNCQAERELGGIWGPRRLGRPDRCGSTFGLPSGQAVASRLGFAAIPEGKLVISKATKDNPKQPPASIGSAVRRRCTAVDLLPVRGAGHILGACRHQSGQGFDPDPARPGRRSPCSRSLRRIALGRQELVPVRRARLRSQRRVHARQRFRAGGTHQTWRSNAPA